MKQKTIQVLSISLFAAALLWGIYTLLYYIGVPVHTSVIVTGQRAGELSQFCDGADTVCRGWYSLFDFIGRTFQRMGPLSSYAVFSAIVYAGALVFMGMNTGTFGLRFNLRPWHGLLAFFLAVFCIFTTLSFGSQTINTTSGNQTVPVRQIIEPHPEVYRNMADEAMQTLKNNFDRLQGDGCLKQLPQNFGPASTYVISGSCIYKAFFQRVGAQMLYIFLLVFEMLILGHLLLTLLRVRPRSVLLEAVLSIGLGACAMVLLLWFLSVLKLYTSPFGWGLVAVIPLVCYKQLLYWARVIGRTAVPVERSWYDPVVLLTWLLISYLALNFLNVIRPFPIGWDDLGSYINRPRLLVSYGEFIFSMSTLDWSFLPSLGFLLFGYKSPFGATAAMQANWMSGLLAVMALYAFTSLFLGKGRGMLAATLYYILPMVGHFSFADMKIDNAIFFWSTLGILCVFYYLFSPESDEDDIEAGARPSMTWLVMSALFLGYAFATKSTTTMVVMALGAVTLGVLLHWTAFVGSLFITIAAFGKQGILGIHNILERVSGNPDLITQEVFYTTSAAIGLALIAFAAIKNRDNMLLALKVTVVLLGVFAASMLPFLTHNYFLYNDTIPKLRLAAPNMLTPQFQIYKDTEINTSTARNTWEMPEDLKVDPTHEACQATGHLEELGRYWGYREGWGHYLKLPFRLVMNLDSAGYYVTTMPALLLVPLIVLLPFFWRRQAKWLRWLFLGTLLMMLQWMFLAKGIPWYGIGTFLGLVVMLEVLVAKSPDVPTKAVLSVLIAASILVMLNNRFWQFEMQRNLFEYPMGKVSYETLRERTIPHYDDIADSAVARNQEFPDRPYMYRVGTFIPYFVPKNLEILGINDHQLDFFNCLFQEQDPQLTVQRLKALGFNSIIFDTNTATIERNPNGSLHKKVNKFVNFLNNPQSGLKIVINDPGAGVAHILIP